MAAHYPGLYINDTFFDFKNALAGELSDWHSYLYSLLFNAAFSLTPNLSLLGWFQIFLFSTICAWLFSFPSPSRRTHCLIWPLFFCFVISPVNGAFAIFYNRDPLFSWLLIAFLFMLFRFLLNAPQKIDLAKLVLMSSILFTLRVDFLPIALLWPVAVISQKSFQLKKSVAFCLATLALHLFFSVAVPASINLNPISDRYRLTATLNSLSYIIRNGDDAVESQIPPHHRENIERIVSLEVLKADHDDYEIPVFHQRLFNQSFTHDEFRSYLNSWLFLIWQNPTLFMEGRWRLFIHMIGTTSQDVPWNDELSLPVRSQNDIHKSMVRRLDLKKAPLADGLPPLLEHGSFSLAQGRYGWLTKIILMTALPGLMILLLGPLFIWRTPIFAVVCLIFASRIGVVFLTAPAAQFKYIYSLYLFGFFGPILAWTEWQVRSERIKDLQSLKVHHG